MTADSDDAVSFRVGENVFNIQGGIHVKGKKIDGDQYNTLILTLEQQQKLKAEIAGMGQDDQATILEILKSGTYPDEITLRDFVMSGRVKIGDVSYRIVNEDMDNESEFRYRRQK